MTGTPPSAFAVTDRTRLKRMPKRGVFDRSAVYRILDEGLVCHVAFAVDGQPYAIPTGYARVGDVLYLHGSAASRIVPFPVAPERSAAKRSDHGCMV